MYIWVVLATFIVALAAFNLPIRPDMRNVYVSPQAEAVVTKLYLQHKAAEDFVAADAQTRGTYVMGELLPDDLSIYLPMGFELSADADTPVTEQNISFLYCLDKNSPNLAVSSPQCNGDYTPYLISYGCIPERWKNIHNGKPNNDLIEALHNIMGYGGHVGYAEELTPVPSEQNLLGSSMGINIRDKMWLSIPQYIISSNAGEHSFYNVCGDAKQCGTCLVYMTVLNAGVQ